MRASGRLTATTLAALASAAVLATTASAATPFVNEFHYDNVGSDVGEGVELAGSAGTDLTGYALELYSGYDRSVYTSLPLTGVLPDQQAGYGTRNFDVALQNGAPDAIVLRGPGGVVQTVGYEGSFTALDGAAAGRRFSDIGVFEPPSTPVGQSLQLRGTGTAAAAFTWHTPAAATPGLPNTGQRFSPTAAAPTTTTSTPAPASTSTTATTATPATTATTATTPTGQAETPAGPTAGPGCVRQRHRDFSIDAFHTTFLGHRVVLRSGVARRGAMSVGESSAATVVSYRLDGRLIGHRARVTVATAALDKRTTYKLTVKLIFEHHALIVTRPISYQALSSSCSP